MKYVRSIASILLLACLAGGCSVREKVNAKQTVESRELEAECCKISGDRQGMLTIISDDGLIGTATALDELCGARGIRCSIAGAVCFVDPYKAEWDYMLSHGNIDLVNHSYSHIAMAPDSDIAEDKDALRHEIADSKSYLEGAFGQPRITFVCPENKMCDNGYEILEESGYWAVRKGTRGYNSTDPKDGQEPGDWFNLMCFGIMDDELDTAKRNEWIDTSLLNGDWVIEMWHCVYDKDEGRYQTINYKDAVPHLDYVKQRSDDGSLWVTTFEEATRYIRERQNCTVTATTDNTSICVNLTLTNEKMDPAVFNTPVTVRIMLTDDLVSSLPEGTQVMQNAYGSYILADVVPGVETVIPLNA